MRSAGRGTAAFTLLALAAAVGSTASADPDACFSGAGEARIAGCTEIIEGAAADPGLRSQAYAARALAYSLQGHFEQALPDYDAAIALDPASAMALNNRAWTLFRLNRLEEARRDVESAISLEPGSAHAFDTRAHIRQSSGEREAALADYERAIGLGGQRFVMLYQCGLAAAKVYDGKVDGVLTLDTMVALRACVARPGCDPLPPDEECREATS